MKRKTLLRARLFKRSLILGDGRSYTYGVGLEKFGITGDDIYNFLSRFIQLKSQGMNEYDSAAEVYSYFSGKLSSSRAHMLLLYFASLGLSIMGEDLLRRKKLSKVNERSVDGKQMG